MLTNTELVEAFIKRSLRQQDVLMANPSFRAESICGVNQLMNDKDGVILKIDLQQQSVRFYLRQKSSQTLFLRKLLYRHQFLVVESPEDSHFETYHYFSVQRGYKFNCNTGRVLWKNWRAIKRLSESTSRLLIKKGTSWAEIQSIGVSNELIFIETTDDKELVHNFNDPVLWLNKMA